MKTHYTCAEMAEMKLPGFPGSERGLRTWLEKRNWPTKNIPSRGKNGFKVEFQPPKDIMDLIRSRAMHAAIKSAPAVKTETTAIVKTTVKTTELKDWQRDIAEARAAICAEVKRLAAIGGTERAIRSVIDMAALGTLPEHLQQLVVVANAKAGSSRALSRTSIYRWLSDLDKGIGALAPKAMEKNTMPAWAGTVISLMARPQKPSLKDCMREINEHLPAGIKAPSYWAADRFLKKMSKVDVQRGRMGSREIKNILPFVRRDTTGMWPSDAYTADGHSFDAEVAHRDHGRPFRPEVTTVLDISTRKVVGWSVDLAESTWSVLDALRHGCLSCGIPAIFYVDNGSGFKNAAMSHEATGFMARLGITLTHSLPYNSQARGLEERSHKTFLVRAAKKLPTYIGKDMDAQAKQKVFKITRADIKKTGTSKLLISWNDFIQFLDDQIKKYNDQPHRALARINDPITGNKRHQTPNEAWDAAIAEGWKPTPVDAHESDDLFRPYKECKVARGEVRLYNNLYFSHDLTDYHGDTVRVGYDIHDASKVWVRNKAGQLICVAEFEANKRDYFPQSFIRQAAQKRAEGRIKRAEAKIEEAQAELDAPLLIEHQQPVFEVPRMAINNPREQRLPSTPDVQIVENGVLGNVIEMPVNTRPMFDTQAGKYRWLNANPREITKEDEAWLDYYRLTAEWSDLFGDREVATR